MGCLLNSPLYVPLLAKIDKNIPSSLFHWLQPFTWYIKQLPEISEKWQQIYRKENLNLKNDLHGGEFPVFGSFFISYFRLRLEDSSVTEMYSECGQKSSKSSQVEDKEGGPVGWKMLRGMLFLIFLFALALYLRQTLVKKRHSYNGGSRESTHNSERKTSLTRRTENRYLLIQKVLLSSPEMD